LIKEKYIPLPSACSGRVSFCTMRVIFSTSSILLLLASTCDAARVHVWADRLAGHGVHRHLVAAEETATWGENLVASFTNRAAQARALAGRATNTHQRWVAVRELIADTSQAAAQGEAAMQDLGATLRRVDQEIDDNDLRPLLDGELQVADLQALRNGDALVSIAHDFVGIADDLVRISQLSEAIVDTMVAVLDLTDSVPELANVWSGFDTQHLRQLTARVASMSERFSEEAEKLHVVETQLEPLTGWDEMGRWGRARVVTMNFISLRRGMHGLHASMESLNSFYDDEASALMIDMVSTVRSMQTTATRYGGR